MCPFDFDVQTSNLRLMNTIRFGLEHDPIDICRAFGLQADAAERLRSFTPDQLWNRIQAMGPISIVVLRSDFLELLDTPTVLAATLAAAQPPQPGLRSSRDASSPADLAT